VSTRRHVLEQSGLDPQAHGALQRTFDGLRSDIDGISAADIPFTANAADWVAPVPTTVAEALRRIAANSAGAHPVP
jgi:hypothetical protein